VLSIEVDAAPDPGSGLSRAQAVAGARLGQAAGGGEAAAAPPELAPAWALQRLRAAGGTLLTLTGEHFGSSQPTPALPSADEGPANGDAWWFGAANETVLGALLAPAAPAAVDVGGSACAVIERTHTRIVCRAPPMPASPMPNDDGGGDAAAVGAHSHAQDGGSVRIAVAVGGLTSDWSSYDGEGEGAAEHRHGGRIGFRPPIIRAVEPLEASTAGGALITVTGSGFGSSAAAVAALLTLGDVGGGEDGGEGGGDGQEGGVSSASCGAASWGGVVARAAAARAEVTAQQLRSQLRAAGAERTILPADIVSYNDSALVFRLPPDAGLGGGRAVVLRVAGQWARSPRAFRYAAPAVGSVRCALPADAASVGMAADGRCQVHTHGYPSYAIAADATKAGERGPGEAAITISGSSFGENGTSSAVSVRVYSKAELEELQAAAAAAGGGALSTLPATCDGTKRRHLDTGVVRCSECAVVTHTHTQIVCVPGLGFGGHGNAGVSADGDARARQGSGGLVVVVALRPTLVQAVATKAVYATDCAVAAADTGGFALCRHSLLPFVPAPAAAAPAAGPAAAEAAEAVAAEAAERASGMYDFGYLRPAVARVSPTGRLAGSLTGESITVHGADFGSDGVSSMRSAPTVLIGAVPCSNATWHEIPVAGRGGGGFGASVGFSFVTCTAPPGLRVGPQSMTVSVAAQTANATPGTVVVSCDPGSFGRTGEVCTLCPRGARCQGGGYEPQALQGWWLLQVGASDANCQAALRATRVGEGEDGRGECPYFVPCEPKAACDGVNKCAPAYAGERCTTCAAGYYKLQGECTTCPSCWACKVLMLLLFAAAGCVGVYVLSTRAVKIPLASIGVDYFQVLAILGSNNRLYWPDEVRLVFQTFSFFNLNLDLFAPECLLEGTYKFENKGCVRAHWQWH
jgi:hypothetical protein